MLERQPGDVKDLLLRTALLDRVNGELADLLTGRPGSERILLELEDANAFVVSLDPERTWFRYHHLFADLLRLELRRTLPEHVPTLHRRAAGWFAQHGHVVEAIRQTQAADDWHDAARLLADHSFGLTLDGQVQTIQALLQAFPPGASADPELAPGGKACSSAWMVCTCPSRVRPNEWSASSRAASCQSSAAWVCRMASTTWPCCANHPAARRCSVGTCSGSVRRSSSRSRSANRWW